MCQYRSAMATRRGDGIDLLSLPDDDSHSAIRRHHGIREDNGFLGADHTTPVQFVCSGDFATLSDYELEYDAGRPDWLTDTMSESLTRRFEKLVQRDIDANRIVRSQDLYLEGVKSIPRGAHFKAGSYLYLDNVTSIPDGARLESIGGMALTRLTLISDGAHIEVGCDLWLNRLKSIPKGAHVTVGGKVYAAKWVSSRRK